MIKITILSSGSGTNAENIVNYFDGNKKIEVVSIISNKEDAFVLERAKKLNIPSFVFSKDEFYNTNNVIKHLIEYKIDFIVLAGFLLKIPQNIIDLYPQNIVNIHPALLPKFGGKGMYGDNVHKAVIEECETKSGITIHYINENYDEGGVIFQAECPVVKGDTFEDVANRVHRLEYEHYPKVIESVLKEKCFY